MLPSSLTCKLKAPDFATVTIVENNIGGGPRHGTAGVRPLGANIYGLRADVRRVL